MAGVLEFGFWVCFFCKGWWDLSVGVAVLWELRGLASAKNVYSFFCDFTSCYALVTHFCYAKTAIACEATLALLARNDTDIVILSVAKYLKN